MRGRISRGCVRPARRSRAEPLRNMATHAEKRVLPYTPDQLFDLVAGVEHYPEFLPWCLGARIRSRRDNVIVADLVDQAPMAGLAGDRRTRLDHNLAAHRLAEVRRPAQLALQPR